MQNYVYLNGEYVAATEAKISIFDRSVLFGDAVYEVIPVYQGQARFMALHEARLMANLTKIKISSPDIDWSFIVQELVERHGGGDLQVYLQVTRGTQWQRQHDMVCDTPPTCFAFTLHHPYADITTKRQGLSATLVEDARWGRCDIKATSLLGNVLLHDQARASGSSTALLTREGFLTEGSISNVFLVDNQGVIKTPPLTNWCLPGITRQVVIELINQLGLPFVEEAIPTQALFNAHEVWITGTTKEIYPINMINDIPVGQKSNLWELLYEHYQQRVRND